MNRGVDSGALMTWFDPSVKQEDRFVAPDFNLGQFFYSAQTARALVEMLDHYRRVCCLCTPRLAFEWARRGRTVRLLEYDRRFSRLPGYQHFDVLRPVAVPEEFDVVVFDPIFEPAARLRHALDAVVGDHRRGCTDVFMTFPRDREAELREAFGDYGLERLSVPLRYNNVKAECEDLFVLYGTQP